MLPTHAAEEKVGCLERVVTRKPETAPVSQFLDLQAPTQPLSSCAATAVQVARLTLTNKN